MSLGRDNQAQIIISDIAPQAPKNEKKNQSMNKTPHTTRHYPLKPHYASIKTINTGQLTYQRQSDQLTQFPQKGAHVDTAEKKPRTIIISLMYDTIKLIP